MSDVWPCLLTVGLASLKINKFCKDKEPIDSLVLSPSPTPYSPQLCSFPVSPSLSFLAARRSK